MDAHGHHDGRGADRGSRLRPLGIPRRPDQPKGFVLEAGRGSMSGAAGMPRAAVVGAGAWGTTLAVLLGRQEPTTLLASSPETAERIARERRNERRLPGIDLPASVHITADPGALASADFVVIAVPSQYVREGVGRVAASVAPQADVLSVVKGLEPDTLLRMTEVIAEAGGFGITRLAALPGPNLAIEIARALPASAVVAAEDPVLADRVVERLSRREFRLYVN